MKEIVCQCVVCQRLEGIPYRSPPLPCLPTFRVKEETHFTFTGVDFLGRCTSECNDPAKKVWICSNTCCMVRAVHLDLVPDMTTAAFFVSHKMIHG